MTVVGECRWRCSVPLDIFTGSAGLSRCGLRHLTEEHTGSAGSSGLGDLGAVKAGLTALSRLSRLGYDACSIRDQCP
jgi:hypothetical protein